MSEACDVALGELNRPVSFQAGGSVLGQFLSQSCVGHVNKRGMRYKVMALSCLLA